MKFQSKMIARSLKFFASITILALLSGVLTSCGTSKSDLQLKINCDRVLKNLRGIYDRPELFENSDFADANDVVILFGPETRAKIEKEILLKFPFLDKLILGKVQGKQWENLYNYAGSIYLISQAVVGTDIKIPYDKSQIDEIATKENAYKEVVLPLARNLFGGSSAQDVKNPLGCAKIDQKKELINTFEETNNTALAFDWASDALVDFGEMLQAIRNCQVSGWHHGTKCAKSDYVSKPIDWTPSPADPFTKNWSDPTQEGFAKFAWCWNKGKSYDSHFDECV